MLYVKQNRLMLDSVEPKPISTNYLKLVEHEIKLEGFHTMKAQVKLN